MSFYSRPKAFSFLFHSISFFCKDFITHAPIGCRTLLDFERFKAKGGRVDESELADALSRRGRRSVAEKSVDADRSPSLSDRFRAKRNRGDGITDPLTPPSTSPLILSAVHNLPRRPGRPPKDPVAHALKQQQNALVRSTGSEANPEGGRRFRVGRPRGRPSSKHLDLSKASDEEYAEQQQQLEDEESDDLDDVLENDKIPLIRTKMQKENESKDERTNHRKEKENLATVQDYLDLLDHLLPAGPPFETDQSRQSWYAFCEDRLREMQTHGRRLKRLLIKMDQRLNLNQNTVNVSSLLQVTADEESKGEPTMHLDTDNDDDELDLSAYPSSIAKHVSSFAHQAASKREQLHSGDHEDQKSRASLSPEQETSHYMHRSRNARLRSQSRDVTGESTGSSDDGEEEEDGASDVDQSDFESSSRYGRKRRRRVR